MRFPCQSYHASPFPSLSSFTRSTLFSVFIFSLSSPSLLVLTSPFFKKIHIPAFFSFLIFSLYILTSHSFLLNSSFAFHKIFVYKQASYIVFLDVLFILSFILCFACFSRLQDTQDSSSSSAFPVTTLVVSILRARRLSLQTGSQIQTSGTATG